MVHYPITFATLPRVPRMLITRYIVIKILHDHISGHDGYMIHSIRKYDDSEFLGYPMTTIEEELIVSQGVRDSRT